jgi:hypothetical protein
VFGAFRYQFVIKMCGVSSLLGDRLNLLASPLTLERTETKMETLDVSLEQALKLSVANGKFIAYGEMATLLGEEMAKQPTTSGQTLDNLVKALEKLVHSTN